MRFGKRCDAVCGEERVDCSGFFLLVNSDNCRYSYYYCYSLHTERLGKIGSSLFDRKNIVVEQFNFF